jgi:hypothetical protein
MQQSTRRSTGHELRPYSGIIAIENRSTLMRAFHYLYLPINESLGGYKPQAVRATLR